MVDSILNSSWWPWSRVVLVPSPKSTEVVPPTDAAAAAPSQWDYNDSGEDDGDGGGDDLSTSVLSSASSKFFKATINLTSQLSDDLRLSWERLLVGGASDIITTTTTNNTTTAATIIQLNSTTSFDNYSTNFIINDTQVSSSTGNNEDYTWWNCSACKLFLDTATGADNDNTSINQTRIQLNDNESTIYLIQVILTALVLGIVILATVIGESLLSFYYFNVSTRTGTRKMLAF